MIPRQRKPLSNSQIVCIILLWAALCTLIISGTPKIDGPVVISLVMATLLIFIPIYKSLKQRKK